MLPKCKVFPNLPLSANFKSGFFFFFRGTPKHCQVSKPPLVLLALWQFRTSKSTAYSHTDHAASMRHHIYFCESLFVFYVAHQQQFQKRDLMQLDGKDRVRRPWIPTCLSPDVITKNISSAFATKNKLKKCCRSSVMSSIVLPHLDAHCVDLSKQPFIPPEK